MALGAGDFLCAALNEVVDRLAAPVSHHLQREAALQDVDGHAMAHVAKTDKADMERVLLHMRRPRPSQQPAIKKQFIADLPVARRVARPTRLPGGNV